MQITSKELLRELVFSTLSVYIGVTFKLFHAALPAFSRSSN
jgi:hypothetical protein